MALSVKDLDLVLISHLHGDHIAGLTFILTELAYVIRGRSEKLLIVGPEETEDRIVALQELLYPGSLELVSEMIVFRSFDEIKQWRDFGIEYLDVNHSDKSNPHGIRLSNREKVFAYSGDGDWSENLKILSRNADLFVCECYGYNNSTPGHMNYQTIKDKQTLLSCRKMVLTHAGPELLENRSKVDLKILDDGERFEF